MVFWLNKFFVVFLQAMISTFWQTCDALSDVFFLLDIGIQLRTGYLEQGLMVYDSKKLAKHYLTSRAFLMDLLALCPLDLLQLQYGTQPLLRCLRFLKVKMGEKTFLYEGFQNVFQKVFSERGIPLRRLNVHTILF